jgi:isoamylase
MARADHQAYDVDIHVMMNMGWEELEFDIPQLETRRWHRVIDTAAAAPADIAHPGQEEVVQGDTYRVRDRSVVVLVSR